MRKLNKYFKGVAEEAQRVRWPTSKELWKAVGIVFVITIICSLVLLLSDYIAAEMMKAFSKNMPSTNTSDSAEEAIETLLHLGGLIK